MNMDNVYEGELRVVNKLTGEIDLNGERISDKVIGYFAYIETVNGFSKTLYWPMEKVVSHAKKYSKSYNSGATIWKSNFDEMAQKTLMRNLLSRWGIMTVDMQRAIDYDNADLADQAIVADGNVDTETGEITPPTETAGTVE
jgi:recombination protein RecT